MVGCEWYLVCIELGGVGVEVCVVVLGGGDVGYVGWCGVFFFFVMMLYIVGMLISFLNIVILMFICLIM